MVTNLRVDAASSAAAVSAGRQALLDVEVSHHEYTFCEEVFRETVLGCLSAAKASSQGLSPRFLENPRFQEATLVEGHRCLCQPANRQTFSQRQRWASLYLLEN